MRSSRTSPTRQTLAGRVRGSRTDPTRQTSGRSGEELQDKPDPPDVRQVGRGSAPLECLPDPPDVRQVGRACPIIQMLALHTANLSAEVDIWAFAEAARPARSPAGRAGSSGCPASARPARRKARPGRPKAATIFVCRGLVGGGAADATYVSEIYKIIMNGVPMARHGPIFGQNEVYRLREAF